MKNIATTILIVLFLSTTVYFLYQIIMFNPVALAPEASPSPLIIKTTTLPQVVPPSDCTEVNCKG